MVQNLRIRSCICAQMIFDVWFWVYKYKCDLNINLLLSYYLKIPGDAFILKITISLANHISVPNRSAS